MNQHCYIKLFGLVIVTGLLVPAACAVDPLWTEPATTSGELSGIVMSLDGSTIVAGGDQLIALSHNGHKLWTGWSGSSLAVSSDGNYILTSRDQTIRMISGTGTMLWDVSLGVPVTEVVMLPNASIIAAGGGGRVRLISTSGAGIRQNISIPVNHIRIFPEGDQVVITTKDGVQTSNSTLFSEWADTDMTQDMVEVAADGTAFVTATNNRIRFYSRNGSLQWESRLPGGNALAFAYSRDGSTIVIGRDDNTVQVLDNNGTLLWTARAAHWVTSVAVSDDGNTIAAGSMDKTLAVYDRNGTKLGTATLKNPIRARSVAVSGDGSVIAAVDASAVYGFSHSQFTRPVTTAMIMSTSIVPVTTTVPAIIPVTTPLNPAPSPTATPQAVPSPAVPLLVLVLLALCRSRLS